MWYHGFMELKHGIRVRSGKKLRAALRRAVRVRRLGAEMCEARGLASTLGHIDYKLPKEDPITQELWRQGAWTWAKKNGKAKGVSRNRRRRQ